MTGECSAGPCAGLFLERFEVELDGEDALIDVRPVAFLTNRAVED
jgi:hypothetical protein